MATKPTQPAAQVLADFFVYQIDVAALAAGANTSGSFVVDADSDFKLTKVAYMADLAGAAQTDSGRVVPLVTVLIKDQGSGRDLMSKPVPLPAVFGDGRLPFILPAPRIIRRKATVIATLANYSAATAYGLRLSFIGVKLFQL